MFDLSSIATAPLREVMARKRLTLASVKVLLAAQGVKIRKVADTGEYRVVLAGHGESDAYYTDDLADAHGTGLEMAAWLEKQAAKERSAQ